MTTITAVQKGDSVCIAGDTLSRYGSLKESAEYVANCDKLIRIEDSWIAPTGPASAQLVLRSAFAQLEESPCFDDVDSIFETMRRLHVVMKDEYYLNPKEDEDAPFESSQMDMMICNSFGIFGVYSLRSVQQFKRFYAFGSGSDFAMGAMHALWNTSSSAEQIARAGIEAGAAFDDATGMPMTLQRVPLRRYL